MTPAAQAGLSTVEAQTRLARAGANVLAAAPPISWFKMLVRQFTSPVVLLLLGACVVSAVLKEIADSIAIGAVVLVNAVVGFVQEFRAERAVQSLRSLTAPRARVRRDGAALVIPATDVVPGDLLLLEAGDLVAADAKLIEAQRLATIEAVLTGESGQVEKAITPAPADAPLSERTDRVFMGTSVANGVGVAEVTATGMGTELGRIAALLAHVEEQATPLQVRLAKVSQLLLYACLVIVAVVAIAGVLRSASMLEVFLSAVSLAVAAVPEGLPAVVTVALAIGVQRMVARHVLVRNLSSVETLGCATVICTDKTGTLTTGVMTVRELWGAAPEVLLDAAAACCDAELSASGGGVGDTTEVALLVAAKERGILREQIERTRPRVSENPFDSTRKRMSVLREDKVLYVKGAPESVIALCSVVPAGAAEANHAMAQRGLRVIAVALGDSSEERSLRLVGLVGIADPPRAEAIEAVAAAKAAGITIVMITGDHPMTAQAVARELGIVAAGTASEGLVHARATPEEKLTIVREWKEKGAIVAMTGDGVNDAPALREAHIGVCMGKTGTEVTREASDMVLADDNFASIVAAVREGRGIFDNIRKALVFLLSGNVAELSVMLIAALIGLPVPLLPLHMLWINLVTDGFPALALLMDKPDADVMTRPPRGAHEPILRSNEWLRIIVLGAVEAALALGVFAWALQSRSETEARSMAFAVVVSVQVLMLFASRSTTRVFWEMGAFSNLSLLAVIVVSAAAQLVVHHVPPVQQLFHLAPLRLSDWLLIMAIGLIPVTLAEVRKLLLRVFTRRKA